LEDFKSGMTGSVLCSEKIIPAEVEQGDLLEAPFAAQVRDECGLGGGEMGERLSIYLGNMGHSPLE
jgi:hypothetical protein